ncbi:hypothetical protein AK812_SmicGene38425 [Symbiodinium microadriaticum]|uniref:Uncharacterized protein n=1 Tax=Symbiodinium microadriaticum TaxID=2951 RepID=A0A1Q9CDS0_SYMMI|nr:hypothetical protein AK812_SmicGene38425 [Symbiodinium microadriaticum]
MCQLRACKKGGKKTGLGGGGGQAPAEDGGQDHAGHVKMVSHRWKDVCADWVKVRQMTTYTHFVVDTFETALPQYAGLIVRTPGNLVLFVLYIAAAVYALVKLALLAFWIFWTLLCCLCCCGCCCLRRKSSKLSDDTSKKNGKASKAAEKGKAATAPAKETNKSNNKKK